MVFSSLLLLFSILLFSIPYVHPASGLEGRRSKARAKTLDISLPWGLLYEFCVMCRLSKNELLYFNIKKIMFSATIFTITWIERFFNEDIVIQSFYERKQSPKQCHSRLSGILLKKRKNSGQAGMTKQKVAQFR